MADVTASQLMHDFAIRTSLIHGDHPPRRYLWTDAFAVCNFLGLFAEQRDGDALRLACELVEQTHLVLGKYRRDDPRRGWLCGLGNEEGAQHPTAGGLRIGKALPERGLNEPFDPDLEWERDGQYFHYLTKWMHALDALAAVGGDPTYRRWAVELAKTAHARFSVPRSPRGERGLYWKMSVDLSRPLLPSMGHHDPLDGLLTFQQLQAGLSDQMDDELSSEIDDLTKLCVGRSWETDDPLGLGGLLCDAWRLAGLPTTGAATESALLPQLLIAAVRGLESLRRQRPFERPAESRLAFREFGLSIGLHAAGSLRELLDRRTAVVPGREACNQALQVLARYEHLADEIESFWNSTANRSSASWLAHRDINEVMFATSLAPGGFLGGGPRVGGVGDSE